MASVQGGWRPWWQQGSRVTYSVAPAGSSVQLCRAWRSAWSPPHRACQPWPMIAPVLDEHGAHQWIGAGPAHAPLRQLHGQAHIGAVVHRPPPKRKCPEPAVQGIVKTGRTPRPRKTQTAPECKHSRAERPWAQGQSPAVTRSSFIQTILSAPEITPGHAFRLAGCTAGGESHPALKILIQLPRIIRPRRRIVNPPAEHCARPPGHAKIAWEMSKGWPLRLSMSVPLPSNRQPGRPRVSSVGSPSIRMAVPLWRNCCPGRWS